MDYTDTDLLRSEVAGILMKHFGFPHTKVSYFYTFFTTRNRLHLQQLIMSAYGVTPPLSKVTEYMLTVFMTFPKSSLSDANNEVLMLAQRDLKSPTSRTTRLSNPYRCLNYYQNINNWKCRLFYLSFKLLKKKTSPVSWSIHRCIH
jgi:hypothetical protein